MTRHSGVPWLLAGDFNIDAIADLAVADAFGFLVDSLQQESAEYRQMMSVLNGGDGGEGETPMDASSWRHPHFTFGGVRDLLKEAYGHHVSTRPPRLQFPRTTAYMFKHKYPQRLDYLFFSDADCAGTAASPTQTRLLPFACRPVPSGGSNYSYTHLSDHYGIAVVLQLENDFCYRREPPPEPHGARGGTSGGRGGGVRRRPLTLLAPAAAAVAAVAAAVTFALAEAAGGESYAWLGVHGVHLLEGLLLTVVLAALLGPALVPPAVVLAMRASGATYTTDQWLLQRRRWQRQQRRRRQLLSESAEGSPRQQQARHASWLSSFPSFASLLPPRAPLSLRKLPLSPVGGEGPWGGG